MVRLLTLLFVLAVLSPAAEARGQSDQDAALRAMQSGEIMSYAEIRKLTEQALGGTVIGQDPPRRMGKRWVYSLRVMQFSGQLLEVEVDAKTGRVLDTRGRR
ncbi:MAG: PepSY domain-containing protein [Pseudomonadota bacterium]